MTIKEFTEAAIQGGWQTPYYDVPDDHYGDISDSDDYKMFLDPKAWEAVGKVKGWGTTGHEQSGGLVPPVMILGRYDRLSLGSIMWSVPQFYMHRMIDSLYEGKTLEEYIATL